MKKWIADQLPHSIAQKEEGMSEFEKELTIVINKHSQENGSDTPDFILAAYLDRCLCAFDRAVVERDSWYEKNKELK